MDDEGNPIDCNGVLKDMTHIKVCTNKNQHVTIDMPMQESKRIMVKEDEMIVEDKHIDDMVPNPSADEPPAASNDAISEEVADTMEEKKPSSAD